VRATLVLVFSYILFFSLFFLGFWGFSLLYWEMVSDFHGTHIPGTLEFPFLLSLMTTLFVHLPWAYRKGRMSLRDVTALGFMFCALLGFGAQLTKDLPLLPMVSPPPTPEAGLIHRMGDSALYFQTWSPPTMEGLVFTTMEPSDSSADGGRLRYFPRALLDFENPRIIMVGGEGYRELPDFSVQSSPVYYPKENLGNLFRDMNSLLVLLEELRNLGWPLYVLGALAISVFWLSGAALFRIRAWPLVRWLVALVFFRLGFGLMGLAVQDFRRIWGLALGDSVGLLLVLVFLGAVGLFILGFLRVLDRGLGSVRKEAT